jgi:hypothetical protein
LLIREASALRQYVAGEPRRGARGGCVEGKMLKALQRYRRARRIATVALLWAALVGGQTMPQGDLHCRRGKNGNKPPAYANCLRSNERPAPSHGPASPPTGFR